METSEPRIVDDVRRHLELSTRRANVSRTTAAVPMGFFLGWAVQRGMTSAEIEDQRRPELAAVRRHALTGPQLIDRLGGVLNSCWLNEELVRFCTRYYCRSGRYYPDFAHVFGRDVVESRSMYSVRDTWRNQEKMSAVLDLRLGAWRCFPPAAVRIFGPEVGLGSIYALDSVAQHALLIAAKALATAREYCPFVVFLSASDDLQVPRFLEYGGRMLAVMSDEGVTASTSFLRQGLAQGSVKAFAVVSPGSASSKSENAIEVTVENIKSGRYVVSAPYGYVSGGGLVFDAPTKSMYSGA
jgi:hypothetical protein